MHRGMRIEWAVTFIPMPMPKTVCITNWYNNVVQLEVCRTCSGSGMGISITAHRRSGESSDISARVLDLNVQLLRLQMDLHRDSMSRDIVNFPSELCKRRSGTFTEVASFVVPGMFYPFSQVCEIGICLLSLNKQQKTAAKLFQRGVR